MTKFDKLPLCVFARSLQTLSYFIRKLIKYTERSSPMRFDEGNMCRRIKVLQGKCKKYESDVQLTEEKP